MYYLVYLSTTKKLMGTAELESILEVSRRNNAKENITGILIYAEGSIIQLLEGDKEAVFIYLSKDSSRPPHTGIIKLKEGELLERNFPHWSMGFEYVSESQISELTGYTNLQNQDIISSVDNNDKHPAIVFLKSFIKHNLSNKDY